MKQIDLSNLPFYCSLTVIVIALFSILLCGCGHNASHLGLGSAFRLGSGEFSLSYYDGLFLSSVNRENMCITAEIDSTVGASYDPVTGSFKGIKSISIETGPQLNGYSVDVAKENPEALSAYYNALKSYYQSRNQAPQNPLISEEKSKEATKGISEVIKETLKQTCDKTDDDGDDDEEEILAPCDTCD